MRIRMLLAASAIVACFTMMSQVSEAGGRVVTYYGSPFAYVGPAPVYAMPAPVTTAYYQPAITSYYAPAVVPVPGVVPVYYQPAPVVVQPAPVVVRPVTTYYAPAVSTYSYGPRRVVYKTRRPGLFNPNYRTVVRYK